MAVTAPPVVPDVTTTPDDAAPDPQNPNPTLPDLTEDLAALREHKAAKKAAEAKEVKPEGKEKPEEEKPEAKKDEPKVEEEPPESASKGILAVQKAKKRADEEILAKRREIETERQRIEADKTALEPVRQVMENAAFMAAEDILRTLKIPEERWGQLAKEMYFASPEGRKENPNGARDAHAKRKTETEVEQTRRELKELKDQIAQQNNAAMVDQFLSTSITAATDQTPTFKRQAAKNPAAAKRTAHQAASDLYRETGVDPTPQAVAERAELNLREQLGLDGTEPAATKIEPTPKTNEGGTKKAPKTLGSDLATTSRPPPPPKNEEEQFEQDLEALRAHKRARAAAT